MVLVLLLMSVAKPIYGKWIFLCGRAACLVILEPLWFCLIITYLADSTCQGRGRFSGALTAFTSTVPTNIINYLKPKILTGSHFPGMVVLKIRTGGSENPRIISKYIISSAYVLGYIYDLWSYITLKRNVGFYIIGVIVCYNKNIQRYKVKR